MDVELWRPIIESNGDASVSSLGRVYSQRRGLLKPHREERGGYLTVWVVRTRRVHHLVLEAFVGPRPFNGAECRHGDGDPSNNAVWNLTWGTRLENAADKRTHGTHENARRQTCRRRGHALVEPNLEAWTGRRGGRSCYSCHWGYTMMLNERRQGNARDRDLLADLMYAHLIEGGPSPRRDPELRRRRASVIGAVDQHSVSTLSVIRAAVGPGQSIAIPEALRLVQDAGVATSHNGVCTALARSVQRGEFMKVERGVYQRVAA